MLKIAISLASCALLGASCSASVRDFVPPVLDSAQALVAIDSLERAIDVVNVPDYYGKYSFRYGYLSNNLFDSSQMLFVGGNADTNSSLCSTGFQTYLSAGTYCVSGESGDYRFAVNVNSYRTNNKMSADIFGTGWMVGGTSYSFTLSTPGYLALQFDFAVTNVRVANFYTYMVNQGANALAFQPYAYGFSYDTPITGAGSRTIAFDSNGDPITSLIYEDSNFRLYTDSIRWNFEGQQSVGEGFIELLEYAADHGTFQNFDWEPNTEGWHEIGIGASDWSLPAYAEINVTKYSSSAFEYGIFQNLQRIEWAVYPDLESAASDSSIIYPNVGFFNDMLDYYSNGLLDTYGFASYCSPGWSGYFECRFYYDPLMNLNASPVYVDVHANGSISDTSLMPSVLCTKLNGGSIRPDTLFDVQFSGRYAGMASEYVNPYSSTDRTNVNFNRLSYFIPENRNFVDLAYIGILTPYANGYADGVASTEGEIDDLTQRILDLEDDISQYEGLTYEQIYNRGLQAGLNDSNGGVRTFNALFSNILVSPLTILNGLADISFFGMPILTAILSLLMVAMALWLFKRFK